MLRLTTAAALLAATSSLAHAVEPDEFAAAMKAASARAQVDWSVTDARAEGDAILLEDITVSKNGQPLINLGTMRFEGVAESPEGIRFATATGETIERSYPAPRPSEPEMKLTVARYGAENGLIPGEGAPDFLQNVAAYGAIVERVFAEDLRFDRPATVALELGALDIQYGYESEPFTFSAKAAEGVLDITAALAQDAPPDAQAWFAETGYDVMRFGVEMDGSYDTASGTFDVPTYRFAFEDMGTLEFELAASGMTPELMQGFGDAMTGAQASQDDKAALGMGLMGMMIQKGTIRFTDDGLTDNIFALAEKQTGQNRQGLKGVVLGSAPIGLGMIGASDLVGPAFNALNAYFDAPGSLEISIANNGPVPVGAIATTAQTNPKAIAPMLGLGIAANGTKY